MFFNPGEEVTNEQYDRRKGAFRGLSVTINSCGKHNTRGTNRRMGLRCPAIHLSRTRCQRCHAASDLTRAVKDCKYFYTVVGDSVPDSIITNEEFANLIDVIFRNLSAQSRIGW